MLVLTLSIGSAVAQAVGNSHHPHPTPSIDDQVKTLARQLSLSGKQQDAVKVILRGRNDQLIKVRHDTTVSAVDRFNILLGIHENADQQIRAILDEDQAKTFDHLRRRASPSDTSSPQDSTPPPAP